MPELTWEDAPTEVKQRVLRRLLASPVLDLRNDYLVRNAPEPLLN